MQQLSLEHVDLLENVAAGSGGGIFALEGSIALTHVDLVENAAGQQAGGVVARSHSNVVSEHCTFYLNQAGGLRAHVDVDTSTAYDFTLSKVDEPTGVFRQCDVDRGHVERCHNIGV